jgi:glucose-6-phosphate 1-dehydrogenase
MSDDTRLPHSQPSAQPQPVIFVIFGITGDLAQRKLLPALYHLFKDDLLHPSSVIIGVSRRDVSANEVLSSLKSSAAKDERETSPEALKKIHSALRMHQMSLDDGPDYDILLNLINDIETEQGSCLNRLYYLSVPPQTTGSIVKNLGEHGHNQTCPHGTADARLLVEKPFGYDLASAEQLIKETNHWFKEEQLFRIDHYVAKEMIQNILAFRQSNPLFTALWSRQYISSIEVTAYEQLTIEGRAVFYEGVGALRDFIQSHLLQLLALTTMELPAGRDSSAIHVAKQQLLADIAPVAPTQAIRGQYDGYRAAVENPDSNTETYASLSITIHNDRWQGVPITVRTGKAMDCKRTEIRLGFKQGADGDAHANDVVFSIQPKEAITINLNAKKTGYDNQLEQIDMSHAYRPAFDSAYERVLLDAIRSDHTLFTTSQEVLAAWRIVEQVLANWKQSGKDLVIYSQGSKSVGLQSDAP